jgi:enamine deaminase RidA (YjgF/YER057c/UK114 family)
VPATNGSADRADRENSWSPPSAHLQRPERLDANGNPQHSGDIAAQLGAALDNLHVVLAGAGMTLADLVRLNVYTTDVDTLLQHFAVLTER